MQVKLKDLKAWESIEYWEPVLDCVLPFGISLGNYVILLYCAYIEFKIDVASTCSRALT